MFRRRQPAWEQAGTLAKTLAAANSELDDLYGAKPQGAPGQTCQRTPQSGSDRSSVAGFATLCGMQGENPTKGWIERRPSVGQSNIDAVPLTVSVMDTFVSNRAKNQKHPLG